MPARTWYGYERGVTVPAEVLLRFIEHTRVEPTWLLHGRGEKYRGRAAAIDGRPIDRPGATARPLLRLLEGGRLRST